MLPVEDSRGKISLAVSGALEAAAAAGSPTANAAQGIEQLASPKANSVAFDCVMRIRISNLGGEGWEGSDLAQSDK
jgi:hypothetical protein